MIAGLQHFKSALSCASCALRFSEFQFRFINRIIFNNRSLLGDLSFHCYTLGDRKHFDMYNYTRTVSHSKV